MSHKNVFYAKNLLLSSFEGMNYSLIQSRLGDDGEEVTPVPIPNTEVKLFSADGSWGFPPARVGRCRAFIFLIGRRNSLKETLEHKLIL
jgi:hypothetical protein